MIPSALRSSVISSSINYTHLVEHILQKEVNCFFYRKFIDYETLQIMLLMRIIYANNVRSAAKSTRLL